MNYMRLKLRCSDGGKFGFVETFLPYNYILGAVRVVALVKVGQGLAEPYIYRKGVFEPASVIDEEMGIEKYIKAKKPFYSVLGTGNAIIEARVAYEREGGTLVEKSSHYSLYIPVKGSMEIMGNNAYSVVANRLSNITPEIDSWALNLMKDIAKTQQNRAEFLKARFNQ